MIYLIGGNGFVGSAYARLFERRGLAYRKIGRDDYAELAGTWCDVLVNANGNSKKYLADRDPVVDLDASVRSVLISLTSFKFGQYVHLSSGDVYPDQSAPDLTPEDLPIPVERLSRYGLHKYLAEQLVRNYASNWLIMRMGGFVGPGLLKNAVFDMLHGAPVWLAPNSQLQFIHTDTAAELVWGLVEKKISKQIVNLGAEGTVQLGHLHQRMKSDSIFKDDARDVRFCLNLEKLRSLSGHPLPNTEEEVMEFIQSIRVAESVSKLKENPLC
jgi:nucleoside-diphosphate-sugar epimerase